MCLDLPLPEPVSVKSCVGVCDLKPAEVMISSALERFSDLSMKLTLASRWGAQNRGWKVGYTRKCVHVGFFLLPQLLDTVLPMPKDDAWLWGLWNVHLVSLMLLMITR